MHFRRDLASAYVLVFGGLAVGLLVGVLVIDYEPPIVGWIFGAGGGLALGAFMAALASGTPLAGNPGTGHRHGPLDDLDDDESWRDPR